ncbi:hypothetical protein TCAP_02836 [Tolypocladium capitatum]|uniref:Uncharacterized protein n=1 Tax=Tolypocladium capitatum TaxID=45235 RepID=A0A2K3QI61_9HYPO|nr:hypothetical protein TCAP_02836 [Tolypocladium capitatum]
MDSATRALLDDGGRVPKVLRAGLLALTWPDAGSQQGLRRPSPALPPPVPQRSTSAEGPRADHGPKAAIFAPDRSRPMASSQNRDYYDAVAPNLYPA